MDISGYRGHGRAGHLIQSTWAYADDPSGKNKRKAGGLSLGTKAFFALLLLLAAWGGIRRALPGPEQAAEAKPQAQAADAAKAGSAAGGAAGQAAVRQAAAGGTVGQAAAGGGKAPVTRGQGIRSVLTPEAAAKLDAQYEARIERQMRIIPSYRGPGKADTFPHFADACRLLLATHTRLAWYRYDTHELRVIHEGEGIYYGAFPGSERDALGAASTLWVVSRPPRGGLDALLHLDLESGRELGRVKLDSRFTHDAVRRRDRVYVASTGDGKVLELGYPDMALLATHALFSAADHVNTLVPAVDGSLWAVLHNHGASDLVQVDLAAGKQVARVKGVGTHAHGLVFWRQRVLTLDSEGGALVSVDTGTGEHSTLWQAPEPAFLKGLCVVDDIAFFGVAPHTSASGRSDPGLACELAAFDLKANLLLWRRSLATHGLLNVVAAPHLTVESTAYATETRAQVSYRDKPAFALVLGAVKQQQHAAEQAAQGAQQQLVAQQQAQGAGAAEGDGAAAAAGQQEHQQGEAEAAASNAAAHAKQAGQQQAGQGGAAGAAQVQRRALSEAPPLAAGDPLAQHPPLLDTQSWSSGVPRMLLSAKAHGLAAAGAQLLLGRADVAGLQAALAGLADADWGEQTQRASNAWICGRAGNIGAVKPGAETIQLMFSSQDGTAVYRFLWADRFPWAPLLEQVLGAADAGNVMRVQLARMPPGGRILRHADTGGYAAAGHRIHVVVQSNPGVRFRVCDPLLKAEAQQQQQQQHAGDGPPPGCLRIRLEAGLVFELNNRLAHEVVNGGDTPRIHLIADVAESPRRPLRLRVGEVCKYDATRGIVCPFTGASPGADRVADE